MTIELCTLGTIDLHASDAGRVEALLRRRKRLALLAYLAIERPAGPRRRDSVLAMFWPDADGAHARAALRQALHVIRGALGRDALLALGDDELSLSPGALWCDAVEFEFAAREGRLDDALGLYRGDLLPGLFIDGAAEFDQWLDNARQRCRGAALRAAGEAADAAMRSGDVAAAIARARRAVEISPYDEPASRRLVAALDRAGDRAGALTAYDELTRRMADQFEVAPSAESRALAVAVRARETVNMRVLDTPQLGRATLAVADSITAVATAAVDSATPAIGLRVVPRRRRPSLINAGLVLTTLLLGGNSANLSGNAVTSAASARAASVQRRAISAGARDAYERGLHYLDKRGEDNLALAVRLFSQACDSEPLYADAFAGLGDSFLQLGYLNYLSPSESFPKAIAAARRAIDLDPNLPNSYATLGFALFYYDRDWGGAERAFQRAIALDSTYAPAHQRYAYLLLVSGRPAEARAKIERAEQLTPLSLSIATDAGFIYYYENRLTEARMALRGVLARDSLSPAAHLWLGRVEQRDGNPSLALREYQATGPLRAWAPTIAAVGYVDGLRGDSAAARRALVRLDSIARRRYVTAYAYALLYAALGERDSAFTWLDRSVDERTNWIVWLALDPRWAPIRGDPRFGKLLDRVGLGRETARAP